MLSGCTCASRSAIDTAISASRAPCHTVLLGTAPAVSQPRDGQALLRTGIIKKVALRIQVQRHSSSPTGLSGGSAKPIFDHAHDMSAERQGEHGLVLRRWSSNLPYRSRREEYRFAAGELEEVRRRDQAAAFGEAAPPERKSMTGAPLRPRRRQSPSAAAPSRPLPRTDETPERFGRPDVVPLAPDWGSQSGIPRGRGSG
jgi:hypothetical protein